MNYSFDLYTLKPRNEPSLTRTKRPNFWSFLKGLIDIGRSDVYTPMFEKIFHHQSYSEKSLLANLNYIKTILDDFRGLDLRRRFSEEIFKYSIIVFLLLIVASIVTNSLLIDNLIDQKQLINPNIGNTNYLNSLSYSVGLFFANGLEDFQRNNIHALVIIYSYAILFFALTLFLSFTGANIDRSINRLFFRIDLYCDELKKLIDYMINMIELGEYGKLSKELEKRFSWNKEVMNFIQHLPDKK